MTPCYLYLGDDLVFHFLMAFLFLEESFWTWEFWKLKAEPVFQFAVSHFSYFSDFVVPFLGALEQLKYRPAGDHSGPCECRDGSV